MSFPRYATYKDGSVAWLGKVPAHWAVEPLKREIARVESGTSVNASDEPAPEGRPGVLKTSCVYSGEFDPNENKLVVDEDIARVSCPLKANTLIVSRMNTPDLVGAAGLVRSAPANIFLPDRLPVVPLDEQTRIAAFLDGELGKFDALAAEAQRAIDLLQERRTALISAAVTGQIDVRDAATRSAA